MAASEPEGEAEGGRFRFLSQEWITALGDLVPPPLEGATNALALGQIVENGPEGEIRYTIHLGAAERATPGVTQGTVEGAEVVLVESYDTARRLASGELTPGEAIRAGAVKVRGQARALAANQDLLVALAEALSDLRSRTTY